MSQPMGSMGSKRQEGHATFQGGQKRLLTCESRARALNAAPGG